MLMGQRTVAALMTILLYLTITKRVPILSGKSLNAVSDIVQATGQAFVWRERKEEFSVVRCMRA